MLADCTAAVPLVLLTDSTATVCATQSRGAPASRPVSSISTAQATSRCTRHCSRLTISTHASKVGGLCGPGGGARGWPTVVCPGPWQALAVQGPGTGCGPLTARTPLQGRPQPGRHYQPLPLPGTRRTVRCTHGANPGQPQLACLSFQHQLLHATQHRLVFPPRLACRSSTDFCTPRRLASSSPRVTEEMPPTRSDSEGFFITFSSSLPAGWQGEARGRAGRNGALHLVAGGAPEGLLGGGAAILRSADDSEWQAWAGGGCARRPSRHTRPARPAGPPCAVATSCTPRCAMVRAARHSASVPISSMTITSAGHGTACHTGC